MSSVQINPGGHKANKYQHSLQFCSLNLAQPHITKDPTTASNCAAGNGNDSAKPFTAWNSTPGKGLSGHPQGGWLLRRTVKYGKTSNHFKQRWKFQGKQGKKVTVDYQTTHLLSIYWSKPSAKSKHVRFVYNLPCTLVHCMCSYKRTQNQRKMSGLSDKSSASSLQGMAKGGQRSHQGPNQLEIFQLDIALAAESSQKLDPMGLG